MGKNKFKGELEELFKLSQQSSELKSKKKALQHKCCHKDRRGRYTLKEIPGKDYIFKCRQCHAKINLSVLDTTANGELKDQLKSATNTLEGLFNVFKMQADANKDSKLVSFCADVMNKVYSMKRVFKKTVCSTNNGNNKGGRKNKYRLNTSKGGHSLFH